jgi:hypothetical protein
VHWVHRPRPARRHHLHQLQAGPRLRLQKLLLPALGCPAEQPHLHRQQRL